MDILKKVLLVFGIIIASLIIIVVCLRLYNDAKYSSLGTPNEGLAYYNEPSNLTLYPTGHIEGVTVTRVDQDAVQGFHMVPDTIEKTGVIITYGGSEGTPSFEQALEFAQKGYEVFALFMFGAPHQPESLSKVPLEEIGSALEYVKTHAQNTDTITLYGASKGAEFILNAAPRYSEIDNIIALAPSAYSFAGLDYQEAVSSWTWKGLELPYINFVHSDFAVYIRNMVIPMITKAPISFGESYASAVEMDDAAEDKLIPIQDTNANIVLIAGSDDKMWDSAQMGEQLKTMRPENTELYVYQNAGHIFMGDGVLNTGSLRINVGGTTQANENAFKKSQSLIYEKLDEWHKQA